MIRRPPRSTHCISSAASDVYKRQVLKSFRIIVLIYRTIQNLLMKLASTNPETGKSLQTILTEICSLFFKDIRISTESLNSPQIFEVLEQTHVMIAQILKTNSEYEEMIQRLEADVRSHIRIEQQLKIQVESIQYKLEDQEKIKSSVNSNTNIGASRTQRPTKRKREKNRRVEEGIEEE
eukprot:TRINITY_DN5294_c0_g1_i4.p1 TRINITY_DN5294_c0_g1~~TRINITY_DN5294_c0_g1_i4.p1  ORF type:complete len:186 (+),score=23.26 TRINITY_DN5294_c0_g1_i4:23-559(+)